MNGNTDEIKQLYSDVNNNFEQSPEILPGACEFLIEKEDKVKETEESRKVLTFHNRVYQR